jgi:hypothetical protein
VQGASITLWSIGDHRRNFGLQSSAQEAFTA